MTLSCYAGARGIFAERSRNGGEKRRLLPLAPYKNDFRFFQPVDEASLPPLVPENGKYEACLVHKTLLFKKTLPGV
jgi:hypothetical protein